MTQLTKDWAIYREKLARATADGDVVKAALLQQLVDSVETEMGVDDEDESLDRSVRVRLALAKVRRGD